MESIKKGLRDLMKYPSAVIGIVLILGLVVLSITTLIMIPRDEAIALWRGGESVWGQNPKTVPPKWVNWFRSDKLPESIVRDLDTEGTVVERIPRDEGENLIATYTFEYTADDYPQDILIKFNSSYATRNPFVSVFWITPDGREIRMTEQGIAYTTTYRAVQDTALQRRVGGLSPEIGLFDDPETEELDVLKGTYQIVVDALTFEEGSEVREAEVVIHGKVHGWFGTDNQRRDLSIAILWGTPVALAFGLTASFGSSIFSMIFAAIGVWFGGWVDEVIQRLTEISLTLPFLSILIMVGTFYSKSIWTILLVTVILTIFGSAIKTYRAIFLQVRESPYIEAAHAYGASNTRIIFNYLIPRLVPLLIPGLVLGIPTYVFLEATLASLGLGDPVLPTWGKVIFDARTGGAVYNGFYYWILEPAVLLVLTGLAFAMVGFAMDRIFNPRLRDV